MDTFKKNNLNMLDLLDEILLIIFNKLNTIDTLYSLVDVNERFNRLVFNALHIHNLDTTNMVIRSYYDRRFSIDDNILSKICEKILPRIYHQLNELIVEQNSVKHIFRTGNYPQLDSLSLIDFQKEILFQYLTGNRILHHLLTQQIQHLNIDVSYDPNSKGSKILSSIFALILFKCQRLINLNICQLFCDRKAPIRISKFPSTSCTSSTLIKVKVNVATFDDCLYLLDGRLEHLSTLIIDVKKISFNFSDKNKKKLPELKCFSLTPMKDTFHYEDQIVPLLCRMINLKELTLFLPKATKDKHLIFLMRLGQYDPLVYTIDDVTRYAFAVADILNLQPAAQLYGFIIILDFTNIRLQHIRQFTPGRVRRYVDCWEKMYPVYLRQIHFYNYPSIFGPILHLFRFFHCRNINDRMFFHSRTSNDSMKKSLHKYIDPSLLPNEYGGELDSVESEMNKSFIQWTRQHNDCLIELEQCGVDLKEVS
ncbi:unnamed protein product [Rotaria socialis]